MGAAVIGGVGSGCFSDFSSVKKFINCVDRIEHSKENTEVYDSIKPIFDGFYAALENFFNR